MTDALATISRLVTERRDDHVRRLADYVAMPSVSATGEGIAVVAEHIASVLASNGAVSRLVQTPGSPLVVARWDGPAGSPHVVIYGHYDVQPAGDPDLWTSPPFEPEVRGGRIYGRGTADNKGQHLAHVIAAELLIEVLGDVPCTLTFLLDGEEEVGSPNLDAALAGLTEVADADVVIVSDGPTGPAGGHEIIYGLRGVLPFDLLATGAARDLHSGHYGEIAPNPLWTLVHLLATMKDAEGRITIDGVMDLVEPLGDAERSAMAAQECDPEVVRQLIGAPHLAPSPAATLGEREMALPTLTINGLHGGYGGPGIKTVLPHTAIAKCDLRLVAGQDGDVVWDLVQRHVERHAPGVETASHGIMHPCRTPMDHPGAEPLRRAIESVTGRPPVDVPVAGGSLPLWVFTRSLGLPAFLVPFGNADQANHAPDENLVVDDFHSGIAIAATAVVGLADSLRR